MNYHSNALNRTESGKHYVLTYAGKIVEGDTIVRLDYPMNSRGSVRLQGPPSMKIVGTVTGLGKVFKVSGEPMQYAYVEKLS